METYSDSCLRTYMTCPRQYYYKYVMKRVPPSEAGSKTEFGSAFHLGVELRLKGNEIKDSIDAAVEYFGPHEDPANPVHTTTKLKDLLTEYFIYYTNDGYTPIPNNVEGRFNLPLMGTAHYNGKIDSVGLSNRHQSRIYGTDVKTTSAPYMFIDKPNSQMSGYCWAGRQLIEGFSGMIIDLVGVYKSKPERLKNGSGWKQGASPSDVFFRYVTNRSDEEIKEWELETCYLITQIRGDLHEGIWRMQSDGCRKYNRECSYLNICKAPHNIREDLLMSSMFIDRREVSDYEAQI